MFTEYIIYIWMLNGWLLAAWMERQQLHLIWSIAQGETAADYLRPQLAEKYRDCPCPAELLELRHLDSWTVAKSCQIRIDHWTPSCHQDLPVHLFVADYRGYGALQSDSGHLELKFGSPCDQLGRLVRRGTFVGNFPEGRTAPRRNWSQRTPNPAAHLPLPGFLLNCTYKLHSIHNILSMPFWKRACFYAKQMQAVNKFSWLHWTK